MSPHEKNPQGKDAKATPELEEQVVEAAWKASKKRKYDTQAPAPDNTPAASMDDSEWEQAQLDWAIKASLAQAKTPVEPPRHEVRHSTAGQIPSPRALANHFAFAQTCSGPPPTTGYRHREVADPVALADRQRHAHAPRLLFSSSRKRQNQSSVSCVGLNSVKACRSSAGKESRLSPSGAGTWWGAVASARALTGRGRGARRFVVRTVGWRLCRRSCRF